MKRGMIFTILFLISIISATALINDYDFVDTDADWDVDPPGGYSGILIQDGKIYVDTATASQAGDFFWVANADIGTVTKVDTNTNTIVGKFRTCPSGTTCSPSRTAVDSDGYVWVGNRAAPYGLVKIAPDTSLCIDRNTDGIITTSNSTTILPWGTDECVIGFVSSPSDVRPIVVDLKGDVWFGSLAGNWIRHIPDPENVNNLSISYTQYTSYGIGGYGGAIDKNGRIWFSRVSNGASAGRIKGFIDTNDPSIIRTYTGGCQAYGLNTYDEYGVIGCYSDGYGSGLDFYKYDSGLDQIVLVKQVQNGAYVRALQYHSVRNSIFFTNWNNAYVYEYNITPGFTVNTADFVLDAGTNTLGCVVDANGFVWVTDYTANAVRKINPYNKTIVASVTGITAPYTYSDATGSNLFQYISTGDWWKFYEGDCYERARMTWVEGNNQGGIGGLANVKGYKYYGGHSSRIYSGLDFSMDTCSGSDNVEIYFEIRTNADLTSPYVDSYEICITDYRCVEYAECISGTRECLTINDRNNCDIGGDRTDFDRTCDTFVCGDGYCDPQAETTAGCPQDCPEQGGGGITPPPKEEPVPPEDFVCSPGVEYEYGEKKIITEYKDIEVPYFISEKTNAETCGFDANQDGFMCDLNEDFISCPGDCELNVAELICVNSVRCLWSESWMVQIIITVQLMMSLYLLYIMYLV